MKLGITGRARLFLLGFILLLLSLSSLAILRGLSSAPPSPPVTRLMPTLTYGEVKGDSQVTATITLGDGCLGLTSWGTSVQSGKKFSVNATVVDTAGPEASCTLNVSYPQNSYSLGQLAMGNYSFSLSACIVFASYGGAIDCRSNKTTIFFQTAGSDSQPPPIVDDEIKLEYQDINGDAFVNATIIVPPCFLTPTWNDASQSGNGFVSNVTVVYNRTMMIMCVGNRLARNSYDLGHLAPGLYSFTLNLCEVIVGWGSTNTNSTMSTITSTDCSNTRTIFFMVPGNPAPQPQPFPPKEWYMIFGPFAIIIILLLRLLGIPIV